MNNKHNRTIPTQQDIFKTKHAAWQWYQIAKRKGNKL